MERVETLREALVEQLQDIYSAENQLMKALPKMQKKASNEELQEAFKSHIEETQGQVDRLDQIASMMNEKVSGKTCKAMQGLIEEGKEVLEEESDNPALIDALLIAAARRVEHYEVAAYKNARAAAQVLGDSEAVKLLDETLAEEAESDRKLATILEKKVLPEANMGAEGEEEEEEEELEMAGKQEMIAEEEEEEAPPRKASSRGKKTGQVKHT